jgi:cytochrome c-type biogenesis protein CcmH/NrfG
MPRRQHPSPSLERIALRKNYTFLGLVIAMLVVAAIVAIGPHVRSKTPGGTTDAALPPGHPQTGSQSPATDAQTAQVAATVKRLAAKYIADPGDMRTLTALGYAYFLDQQYGKAVVAFDTVLKREPGNVTALVQRAIVWHAQGDDTRAIAALAAVIKADVDNQEAHYDLGIVYFAQGKRDLAKTEWQTAANINPTNAMGVAAQNFVDLLNGKSATPAAGQ